MLIGFLNENIGGKNVDGKLWFKIRNLFGFKSMHATYENLGHATNATRMAIQFNSIKNMVFLSDKATI